MCAFFQSTSTNVLSSFADSTAGKLLGLFSSEKDKAPSPLIIPVDDALRPDVFPSVECSLGDSEVEVLHVRGMKKGRRRGRTRDTANSDGSDVTSGRRSSPESGYRSVPEGVSSTPIVSSDVSNDSLTSVCSCPSSAVTSPPPSVVRSTFTADHKSFSVPIGVSTELPAETPSIITRTAAEDELLRSILNDHCKSFCTPAVSVVTSSTPLPADDPKCASTNADVPSSSVDVYETSLSASPYTAVEENAEVKLDVTALPEEEEKEDAGEMENVAAVTETGLIACEPSVVADEISIYDDAGLAVQLASVHETADESVAGFCTVHEEHRLSGHEPVSWLSLADTDSLVSDTKMSRTSSMSSSLSLESLAHSAEVRYKLSQSSVIVWFCLPVEAYVVII